MLTASLFAICCLNAPIIDRCVYNLRQRNRHSLLFFRAVQLQNARFGEIVTVCLFLLFRTTSPFSLKNNSVPKRLSSDFFSSFVLAKKYLLFIVSVSVSISRSARLDEFRVDWRRTFSAMRRHWSFVVNT